MSLVMDHLRKVNRKPLKEKLLLYGLKRGILIRWLLIHHLLLLLKLCRKTEGEDEMEERQVR